MTIFARAPLRIDFAGGWSDVPSFADAEGGAVVNAAITHYVHVEAILGDKRIRLHDVDDDRRVTLPSSREIRYDGTLDVHKAALNMLPVTGGIEIHTRSDVPSGSGLGEDAALGVALLAVLAFARGERYDADELAAFGAMLDAQELHRGSSRPDHWAAAVGGVQALRLTVDGVRSRPLSLGPDAVEALEHHLVLLFTGRSHFSQAIWDRVRAACDAKDAEVCEALRRIRDLAGDAETTIAAADWRSLAEVMNEHWRHQQRLDATIATERTRAVERAVRTAGAWGVKAAGAGAGGTLIVMAPPDRRADVVDAAAGIGAVEVQCNIAGRSVEAWESDEAAN